MDKTHKKTPPLGAGGLQINLSQKTLHFKKPARTSRGSYTEHHYIAISIMDDKGSRIGLGECAPLPDLSCDRDAYISMSTVADLINKALESDDYSEFLRPYPALLFALESAMYDYQQNPLLYDTPFARSEMGLPMNGLVWMSDYDDMLAQVKKKILQGFHCIKLKIGTLDWDDEMRLIKKIRSRFSKDTITLRVDANGAFAPADAMSKLEQLAKYDIHSIEQPIKAVWMKGEESQHNSPAPDSWNVMAHLCRNTPLPIALDEELIGVYTFSEKQLLLDTIHPQYIVVKPSLHGGMSGSIEWISEAQKRGIGSWITSALEGNIGLRNVALLAARVYGTTPEGKPQNMLPQGLGTGQLFTDNIEMDIEVRRDKLWRCEVSPS